MCVRSLAYPEQNSWLRHWYVGGLGAEEQGFIVVVDFQLMFNFLAGEMEDCRHYFCSTELHLPGLDVFTYGCHVFA